jgi:hypothetical protein
VSGFLCWMVVVLVCNESCKLHLLMHPTPAVWSFVKMSRNGDNQAQKKDDNCEACDKQPQRRPTPGATRPEYRDKK